MIIDKYKNWHINSVHAQAKHLISNCSFMACHNMEQHLIFHFDTWEVVDKQSKNITCFETEQEALDFALDRFSETKDINQLYLFETGRRVKT